MKNDTKVWFGTGFRGEIGLLYSSVKTSFCFMIVNVMLLILFPCYIAVLPQYIEVFFLSSLAKCSLYAAI